MNSDEEWRDIDGFEGLYQISNYGRVRSLDRTDSMNRLRHGKVLADKHNNRHYHTIAMRKNGQTKYKLIHRLVAMAFIPNPNHWPEVNHIDEDKANNAVDNLEWCTDKYNLNYGTRKQRIKKSIGYKKKTNYFNKPKPIVATNVTTGFCIMLPNMHAATKRLGIDFRQVSAVIRGKQRTAHGYKFELAANA